MELYKRGRRKDQKKRGGQEGGGFFFLTLREKVVRFGEGLVCKGWGR